MAAAVAPDPGCRTKSQDDDDAGADIFTRTLAALDDFAAGLPVFASRLPAKDTLRTRQRVLAQSGGSAEKLVSASGTIPLRLRERAGEGTFCVVFAADLSPVTHAPANNDEQPLDQPAAQPQQVAKPVAVKLELRRTEATQLRDEFRTYKCLQSCYGIPKIHGFGEIDFHKALVMDLLGPSLEYLYVVCGKRFSIKTVAMLAKQMITRLQAVHEQGLIYRDVKPENFLVGNPSTGDATTVYLVDFGMAKAYRDPETNAHLPPRGSQSLSGTARYMSLNAHGRNPQSRRDDLEALGHVLLFFVRGNLPWQGIKHEDATTRHDLMRDKKVATTIQDLCGALPFEFTAYMTYTRSLSFFDEPDYIYLRALFDKLLADLGAHDDGVYDWTRLQHSPARKPKSSSNLPQEGPATPSPPPSPSSSPGGKRRHSEFVSDLQPPPPPTHANVGSPAGASASKGAAPLVKKKRVLFYDSITQHSLLSLYREIVSERFGFHRRISSIEASRGSLIGGAIRSTTAAATKVAAAAVGVLTGQTIPHPPRTSNRPLTVPFASMISGLTGDNSSGSGSLVPSAVISTSFTEYLDKTLVKIITEIEDLSDKQLQDGDWASGHMRVIGWFDELVAATSQEQERLQAEHAKWEKEQQARKSLGLENPANAAVPRETQGDSHCLRLDDKKEIGVLEVDSPPPPEVDYEGIDDGPFKGARGAGSAAAAMVAATFGRPSPSRQVDLFGPPGVDGDDFNGDDHDSDLDNPDAFSLVFRTASGSRKVARLKDK